MSSTVDLLGCSWGLGKCVQCCDKAQPCVLQTFCVSPSSATQCVERSYAATPYLPLITTLTPPHTHRPRYFEGIVEIVELPPDTDDADNNTNTSSSRSQQQQQQKQLQQQLVQVLLAAALYAADSSTHMLPCEQPAASAAAGVPELHGSINTTSSTTSSSSSNSASVSGLSYVCGSIVRQGLQLNTPWSGSQCQLQAQQLLQHFVSNIRLPANTTSSSKGARGSQQLLLPPTQQQPQADAHSEQQQQQLVLVVCHMFPLLLDQLRDTLLAQHRHRKLQDKGADMGEASVDSRMLVPSCVADWGDVGKPVCTMLSSIC